MSGGGAGFLRVASILCTPPETGVVLRSFEAVIGHLKRGGQKHWPTYARHRDAMKHALTDVKTRRVQRSLQEGQHLSPSSGFRSVTKSTLALNPLVRIS